MRVGCAEQVSNIVHCWFSGSPKNSTKQWWQGVNLIPCEESPVCAFFFWTLVFLLIYGGLTSLLSFLRVTSRQLCSALISALNFAKYACCEAPSVLSFPSPSPRNVVPPSPNTILHQRPRVSVMPEFLSTITNWHSKLHRKFPYLSVTGTYYIRPNAHHKNRSLT